MDKGEIGNRGVLIKKKSLIWMGPTVPSVIGVI